MSWVSPGAVAVVVVVAIGVLTQIEVDNDVLLVQKSAALPATRPTVFRYLSQMSNYAKVNKWLHGILSLYLLCPLKAHPCVRLVSFLVFSGFQD